MTPVQDPLDLDALQRRIPTVGDKALLDLVNGTSINRESLHFRRSRGFFARVIDTLTGKDAQRQDLIDMNLNAGIGALTEVVNLLCDSFRISAHCLEVTQHSLLETRGVVRRHSARLSQHGAAIDRLDAKLMYLAEQVGDRLNEVDARLAAVELRADADEYVETCVLRWEVGDSFSGLPLAIQLLLLAEQVFSGSPLRAELSRQDRHWRDRFTLRVRRKLGADSEKPIVLSEILNDAWRKMSSDDLEMCRTLLSTHGLDLTRKPLLEVMSIAGELASLGTAAPDNPGATALALQAGRTGPINRLWTTTELLTSVTEEVFERAAESADSARRDRVGRG